MDQARHDHREAHLSGILRQEVSDWQLAASLGPYLDAAEARIPAIPASKQAAALAWLAWARQHRDTIDPLNGELAMPQVPGPSPEDLVPFLDGWTPYGPGS
jgi:hypothetical protein